MIAAMALAAYFVSELRIQWVAHKLEMKVSIVLVVVVVVVCMYLCMYVCMYEFLLDLRCIQWLPLDNAAIYNIFTTFIA
jgi:hypothetical protein